MLCLLQCRSTTKTLKYRIEQKLLHFSNLHVRQPVYEFYSTRYVCKNYKDGLKFFFTDNVKKQVIYYKYYNCLWLVIDGRTAFRIGNSGYGCASRVRRKHFFSLHNLRINSDIF